MFVAAMLAEAGLPPVFTGTDDTERFAWAPAWDKYGTKVDIENGELPHPGDVMRFSWHGGGEHVTFYDHPVETEICTTAAAAIRAVGTSFRSKACR